MENKLSPFKIILFTILVLVIVIAVGMFAFRKQNAGRQLSTVTMWGTVNQETFDYFLNTIRSQNEKSDLSVIYTEIPEDQFEIKLIEALAAGEGPDIVLLPERLLLKHRNKLFFIEYSFYPQSTFKDNFIEAGESLLTEKGTWGLPFLIDPLVLYWNRGMLNNIGVSNPPKEWEGFIPLVQRLTVKDSNFNVSKSAIAFGSYDNVKNAKEIILGLIMQAGNPVISLYKDQSGNEKYDVTIDERLGYTIRPADAALNFFTQFSNPSKDLYTWNASLPMSDDMFVSSDLAFYVGFASEYNEIKQRNPNLNFDVALIPQSDSDGNKRTFGKMQFLAVTKNSQNVSSAFTAIFSLTGMENMKTLSQVMNLPPVRRDLLGESPESSSMQVFQSSALISRGFLDPDPERSNDILSNMLKSYMSGKSRLSDAISRADDELTKLVE